VREGAWADEGEGVGEFDCEGVMGIGHQDRVMTGFLFFPFV